MRLTGSKPPRLLLGRLGRINFGLIYMLGAQRGAAKIKTKADRFWTLRPFTRVVYWGRDERSMLAYTETNQLEAIGFIPYTPSGYKIFQSTA